MNAKTIVLATIVLLGATVPLTARQAQATAGSKKTAPALLRTPWGHPDLQGIWEEEPRAFL